MFSSETIGSTLYEDCNTTYKLYKKPHTSVSFMFERQTVTVRTNPVDIMNARNIVLLFISGCIVFKYKNFQYL